MMMNSTLLLTTLLAATQAFAPQNHHYQLTRSSSSMIEKNSLVVLQAQIQFIRGVDEPVVPNVKLTRAKDGSNGVAKFSFDAPNVFDQSTAVKGDVTGMYMLDEEGEISTSDVNARFSNGKPQAIECMYVMKSPEEWDRFMRFMERYGEENGLGLKKA